MHTDSAECGRGRKCHGRDASSRSTMSAQSGFLFTNDDLLLHFNLNFLLPQNHCWTVVTLPKEDISKVVSTLRGTQLTMAE